MASAAAPTVRRFAPGPLPHVRIISTPGIMSGDPCIEGTRITPEQILACINGGESKFETLCGYPYLPLGGYEAVIRWAAEQGLPCSAS